MTGMHLSLDAINVAMLLLVLATTVAAAVWLLDRLFPTHPARPQHRLPHNPSAERPSMGWRNARNEGEGAKVDAEEEG